MYFPYLKAERYLPYTEHWGEQLSHDSYGHKDRQWLRGASNRKTDLTGQPFPRWELPGRAVRKAWAAHGCTVDAHSTHSPGILLNQAWGLIKQTQPIKQVTGNSLSNPFTRAQSRETASRSSANLFTPLPFKYRWRIKEASSLEDAHPFFIRVWHSHTFAGSFEFYLWPSAFCKRGFSMLSIMHNWTLRKKEGFVCSRTPLTRTQIWAGAEGQRTLFLRDWEPRLVNERGFNVWTFLFCYLKNQRRLHHLLHQGTQLKLLHAKLALLYSRQLWKRPSREGISLTVVWWWPLTS